MCSRVFVVVYCGLVFATAGFCLTIAGWFTPSNNQFVYGVRRAGPVLLVVGVGVIVGSCLLCAVEQDRCFDGCVRCYRERRRRLLQRHLARAVADLQASRNHVTGGVDAGGRAALERLHHSCDVCDAVRRSYAAYGAEPRRHRRVGLDLDPAGEPDLSANQSPRSDRLLLRTDQSRAACSDEAADCADAASALPVHDRIFYGSDGQRQLSGSQAKGLPDQTAQLGTPPSVFSTPRSSYAKHVIANDTPRDSTDEATRSTPTTTSPVPTPSLLRRYYVNNVRGSAFGRYPSTGDLLAAARSLQQDEDLVWTPRSDQRTPSTEMTSHSFCKMDGKPCFDV